jgi:hypothetical protein
LLYIFHLIFVTIGPHRTQLCTTFFQQVQFDSAQEEDEEIAAILVAANPSAQPLGFQQSAYVDAVIQHAKRQFHDDNPILKIPAINKHAEDT